MKSINSTLMQIRFSGVDKLINHLDEEEEKRSLITERAIKIYFAKFIDSTTILNSSTEQKILNIIVKIATKNINAKAVNYQI